MFNITILDGHTANPGDLSWRGLEQCGKVTIYDRTLPCETIERAMDADIVLTNKVVLGRQEIEGLPRLKYIGVLATGYNVVDTEAASEHGIMVTNVPAYSTESVAQMVFAHLLAVTNRVEHYADCKALWAGSPDFCYWDTKLTELSNKTFGIVGLGNIGKRVGEIARAFGMRVQAARSVLCKPLGYAPLLVKESQQAVAHSSLQDKQASCSDFSTVKRVPLDELLRTSDVVSLHCPLTEETRHIINKDTLRLMKPTAIVINTGRGPLVDDQAVAEALSQGIIAAYCADVLTEEPPKPDNPLLSQPNAFITPHIAWATTESRERLILIATDNVRAFIEGKPLNVVN